MIDEIPFFVWITSVNPLLIQKNRTRIAGEHFSQEESKDGKPFGAMNIQLLQEKSYNYDRHD